MHLVNGASKAFLKTGRHPFAFKGLNMGHQRQFGPFEKKNTKWRSLSQRANPAPHLQRFNEQIDAGRLVRGAENPSRMLKS